MSVLGTVDGVLGGIATGGPIGGLLSGVAGSAAGMVLQGISTWVLNGTKGALEEVARVIGAVTAPNLESTWFSATYWRVAGLAALLTLPFLCAAAVQAVARADLSLLTRAAFGYLPLSVLGVSLAAPFTMLALAAIDQMSATVASSATTGGARFLDHAATVAAALATATGGSPFFAVIVGLLALMAAMALAVELLIRAAAVYVVVLMLPLAFAALVWPARRVWAVRLVELLASLILSKFVIVAVLSLAGSAFTSGTPGIGELLVAMSLIMLSTASPWALMRILPFTELASGAAGILRGELPVQAARGLPAGAAGGAADLAVELSSRLRAQGPAPDAAGDADLQVGPVAPGTGQAAPAGAGLSGREAVGDDAGDVPPAFAPGAGGDPGPGAGGDPGPGTGRAEPSAPFELPAAWRSDEPVRLDERLLATEPPDGPAEPPVGPENPASGDGEERP